ncbi:MAG: hypothetical protein WD804_04945 [Gemmatimonadota bacterium]
MAGLRVLGVLPGFFGPLAIFFAAVPGLVHAQTAGERLYTTCAAGAQGHQGLAGRCADAALAVEALEAGLGLLMTAGGPVPASPSTAGRRLSTQPRVVVDAGVGWASFRHPDLARAPVNGALEDRRSFAFGPRVTAAVGLFEGFSPAPGFGGVFAVDAVATAQLLRLPGSGGFSGSVAGWGGGFRVGVMRESFSLPGVTLSAMHYRMGGVRNGIPESSGGEATIGPRATSYRAIVGKDLLTVGVSGGVGWDHYGGNGRIAASAPLNPSLPGSPAVTGSAGSEELEMRRRYLFLGANFTWVVAQAAAEIVWADSASPAASLEGTGPYRPGERELQGTFSVRVTF